ncbi:diguanylate cyclase [Oxalobacteraceae bacterium]|nr:diguanylate cyclase [Oxalobacteraceae bacterium]
MFSAPAHLPLTFEALDSLGADSQAILSLLQDRQGFIWIGTIEGGLFRYDGRGAVRYANDPADPNSLPGGRVAALYNDTKGRIWAGTDEGLARFEPSTNSFSRYLPQGGASKVRIIRRIIGDGRQGMWIASWGGLQHFDPDTGRFELDQADPRAPQALAHDDINAVATDAKGGVWAATWPAGLDYRAPGQRAYQHFRLDTVELPEPKLNDVRALLFDAAGQLWMGTDAGVMVWQAGTPWERRRKLPGPVGRINNFDLDRNGAVWVSTRTEGLLRWDAESQRFQSYLHRAEDSHSLPSNAINGVLEDRSGTLWVASFTDGVSRANVGNYGFERILPRDVAPATFRSSNFVRSLGAAPQGRLWLGVDEGLMLFDPASRALLRHYTADPKRPGTLSHNSVYSLYQQPNGPLWIGTSKGLNRLDHPDAAISTIRFEGAANNHINTVVPGRDGVIWLGTGASLIRYHPASGVSQMYVHQPGNSDGRSVDDASAVLEDSQGRVWVGGFFRGGGLDLLDRASGKFRHFRHDAALPDTLSNNKITCLYEDMYGTVWVGTARGLNRMTPAADGKIGFHRYLGKGEPGPIQIEAIQSDPSGILWISTVKGLSRLDPSSGAFSHYAADDGLTEGLYLGSAIRATDGTLYFGGSTGITVVNPTLPLSTPSAPQVAITDIRIFNRSLGLAPRPRDVVLQGDITAPLSLSLPWSASVLSFEFAALHYAAPRNNSYSYWLEGFDTQWVRADARHPVATYTNLDPGNYRFHLRASSNKGLDSPEIILPLAITPPFWQTWWFRSGALCLALLLTWLAYRARIRAFTRRARKLEALVKVRTEELVRSNQKLKALSATDGLTGLANRRSFDEALAREWARAQRHATPLAVAMIDVDFFKLYNDHYGHQAGDDCLRRLAAVLSASVQRATDLAARYGGEEFVFIAPATTLDDALIIAEHIRSALAALMQEHAKSPLGQVTISIGVAAMVPDAREQASALLLAADQALYRAKSAGRNRVAAAPDSTDLSAVQA